MDVPLISLVPLLVAKITIGLNLLSNALLRNVKHSISNIYTSSMNNTPGTNSAIPYSIYLLTILFTSYLNFHVTSVFLFFINYPMTE